MSHLCVLLVDFTKDNVERHDPLHKRSGNPDDKEADENIVVCDVSMGNVTLEV